QIHIDAGRRRKRVPCPPVYLNPIDPIEVAVKGARPRARTETCRKYGAGIRPVVEHPPASGGTHRGVVAARRVARLTTEMIAARDVRNDHARFDNRSVLVLQI